MTDRELDRALKVEGLRWLRAERRDREEEEADRQFDEALRRRGYPPLSPRRRRKRR